MTNETAFFITEFDGFNVMCFVDNDENKPRVRAYLEFDTFEDALTICSVLNMWCEGRFEWL